MVATATIRVLLCDDHALVRSGLRRLLESEPRYEVIGEAAMAVAIRAVELVRTLRAQAGLRTRQPIARLWLALPGGEIVEQQALLSLVADEVNVKGIELIGDESDLVERRVKVLLPKVGKRGAVTQPAHEFHISIARIFSGSSSPLTVRNPRTISPNDCLPCQTPPRR